MTSFDDDQLAVMRECRMLGWSFIMIAELLKLQSPAEVHTHCAEQGWTVPLAQFDAERARCSESAVNGAAGLLTNKGHTVEKISNQLFRVDGKPLRAMAMIELADAPA